MAKYTYIAIYLHMLFVLFIMVIVDVKTNMAEKRRNVLSFYIKAEIIYFAVNYI